MLVDGAAAEQRAHGDRSRGRRSRARRPRFGRVDRGPRRRGLGALRHRRALRHDQHHHQPADAFAEDAVHGGIRRLLQLERERPPRHGRARLLLAEVRGRASRAAASDSTTTRRASTTRRARSRSSRTARSRRPTPSTRTSASPSTRSPIRSTRRSRARRTRFPRSGMDGSSLNVAGIALVARAQQLAGASTSAATPRTSASRISSSRSSSRRSRCRGATSTSSPPATRSPIPRRGSRSSARRAYYQRQDRLLRNDLPGAVPGAVDRVLSRSASSVSTSRATRASRSGRPASTCRPTSCTRPNNVLTAGLTMFRDRSEDARTTIDADDQIGQVALGQFGPAARSSSRRRSRSGRRRRLIPSACRTRRSATSAVSRTTNGRSRRSCALTGGLRVDVYRVTTEATPGYDVASVVAGATPPIDPATLPDVNGDRISRDAVTGEAGRRRSGRDRPAESASGTTCTATGTRISRSCSSPVPATAGNIVPNITVQPETGHNFDVGARFRTRPRRELGGVLQQHVPRLHLDGGRRQLAGGFDLAGDQPRERADSGRRGRRQRAVRREPVSTVAPSGNVACNRGTVLSGTTPLTGDSLAGQPQDNITPWKIATRRPRERSSTALVGRVRAAHRDGRHARLAAAHRLAVPDRAGSARPRRASRCSDSAFGYDWRKSSDRSA